MDRAREGRSCHDGGLIGRGGRYIPHIVTFFAVERGIACHAVRAA